LMFQTGCHHNTDCFAAAALSDWARSPYVCVQQWPGAPALSQQSLPQGYRLLGSLSSAAAVAISPHISQQRVTIPT
jgi:hypothetical protein